MTIRRNIPIGEYLAIDALSSSVAFEAVTRSPYHAKFYRTADREFSRAVDVGTVAHQLLLEGNEDGVVLVDAKDWRTNAAKEAREDAYQNGKTPLLVHQIDDVRRMVGSVRAYVEQTELAGVFGTGQAELTIDWEDYGIDCKARPDYLTDRWHISVKTTPGSAEPQSWARRQMASSGYDFGLMFYDRGLRANGIKVQHRLLVIEQNAPYGASLLALSGSKRDIYETIVDHSIQLWKDCLQTATFPGYSAETYKAEATQWEIAEVEERALTALAGRSR